MHINMYITYDENAKNAKGNCRTCQYFPFQKVMPITGNIYTYIYQNVNI